MHSAASIRRPTTLLPVLAVVLAATPTVWVRGEVLFEEKFDYVDAPLSTSEAWSAHSSEEGLLVQVLSGAAVLAQGDPSREDVHASFATLGAGQTLYVGFDLVNSGGDNQAYFAHFGRGDFVDFTTRLFVTAATGVGDYTLGITTVDEFMPVKLSQGLAFGETYRVVASYAFDTGASRLWVDPTSEASPAAVDIDATGSGVAINGFALRQDTGDSVQLIDNLLVATTFAEALATGLVDADFNDDGLVNLADYTVWRDSLGAEVAAYALGDADGDGQVTVLDYQAWTNALGDGNTASQAAVAVAEPSSWTGGLVATFVVGCGRRWRRSRVA